jgi:hypothetical protein
MVRRHSKQTNTLRIPDRAEYLRSPVGSDLAVATDTSLPVTISISLRSPFVACRSPATILDNVA